MVVVEHLKTKSLPEKQGKSQPKSGASELDKFKLAYEKLETERAFIRLIRKWRRK